MFGQKSCGQLESHCFSKWQRDALAKVGYKLAIIFIIECKNRLIGSKFEKFLKIFFDKIVNCIIISKKSQKDY